uniref:dimethyladenosine transferase 1, mitochondrial-like n=1 Tax=Styela clava TaxID=7725 RepID=UPI00193AC06C|nr:dimethyladenosine transferase 1, mitochondrial-like [Styela clava]
MPPKLRLPPLPSIASILKIYNVRAKKQLAQNFLFDPRIIGRMVDCATSDLTGKHICEVGPGPGGITRSILNKNAESVSVVEKDWRFIQSLQMLASTTQGRMKIHHEDIFDFDETIAFPKEEAKPWTESKLPALCFMGNLPFNVSLPLLFKWLNLISHHSGVYELGRIPAILTFQQEVGERLVALPKESQRCRLSITAQYLCHIDYCHTIFGKSFVPPPKVNVAVIRIIPKKQFEIQLPFKTVDHVVKHIFHFRQKRCRKGIATLFPRSRMDLVDEMIRISGVNPLERPFNLYMAHFRDLCYAYQEICDRIPNIALVDTYHNKEWLKYFDESGEPLNDVLLPKLPEIEDNFNCKNVEALHELSDETEQISSLA